ncbi:hypothetical protein MSAN_01521000 [Mycena sanguinolenta]|uniref:Uncharacterized protein n=1 Tax=Mycena sanguinolenta TaxID=230812 RepID=A0A8H6Y7M0_9AGAR|nr:hypothetical protein MSAN_01521000 [Mycena sanguinolenta]
MDLQPDSDSEFAVVSTENAAVHPGFVSEASGPTSEIETFVNPLDFPFSFFGGSEIGASSFLPPSPSMNLQLHSDPEFSLMSPDNAAIHPGLVSEASGLTSNQLFVNPLDFPSSFFGGPEIGASSLLPHSPPMDFQPHSDPEFSMVSTANNAVHPGVVFGLTSNQLFMNPLDFPPMFFGGPRVHSELSNTGNHIRNGSGTRGRFITAQMTDHLVTNNYNYYISGGVGGAGGIGRDKGIGGGGGAGHGPTLNFYSSSQEEQSEFRTIRLGDINLRKEIRHYGVVDRAADRTVYGDGRTIYGRIFARPYRMPSRQHKFRGLDGTARLKYGRTRHTASDRVFLMLQNTTTLYFGLDTHALRH